MVLYERLYTVLLILKLFQQPKVPPEDGHTI